MKNAILLFSTAPKLESLSARFVNFVTQHVGRENITLNWFHSEQLNCLVVTA